MTTTRQRLTLEEFLELPEWKPALEYADGRVSQKVSPKGKHSTLQLAFCELFNRFARPARLALALPALRATWNDRSYVPDVSVYGWEQAPRDESGEVADDFVDPPDIAIEIVSSGQGAPKLVQKCLWYIANGVLVALLVNPARKSIPLFRPHQSTVTRRGDDGIDLRDVLPGLELTVHQVFDSLKLE